MTNSSATHKERTIVFPLSNTQRRHYCFSAATIVMRTCHIALSCWALLWEPPVPHRAFSFIGWDRAAHSERRYRHIATGGVISSQHRVSCLQPTVQPCFCKISSFPSSLFCTMPNTSVTERSLYYLLACLLHGAKFFLRS